MAAPKASSKTRSKWERIIAAGEASGLTAAEYCEQNGIKLKHYSTWRDKLSDEDAESAGKASSTSAVADAAKRQPRRDTAVNGASNTRVAPEVDAGAYKVSATLPNGLVVEIKCAGEAELSLAVEHLASL